MPCRCAGEFPWDGHFYSPKVCQHGWLATRWWYLFRTSRVHFGLSRRPQFSQSCTSCGKVAMADTNFCGNCGTTLELNQPPISNGMVGGLGSTANGRIHHTANKPLIFTPSKSQAASAEALSEKQRCKLLLEHATKERERMSVSKAALPIGGGDGVDYFIYLHIYCYMLTFFTC